MMSEFGTETRRRCVNLNRGGENISGTRDLPHYLAVESTNMAVSMEVFFCLPSIDVEKLP